MAVLSEGVQYGLSSNYSSENKSLIFVKLTDSALKSVQEFIKNKSANRPTIQFRGNEGVLNFPSDNNRSGSCFSFSLSAMSDVGGPQGSFECVQQCGSRSLESLGPLLHKMTIHAKEDVYETTRQRMAVAEEESKRNCTRVIKASGPGIGRKIKIRKEPGSVVIPARKEAESSPPYAKTISKGRSATQTPPIPPSGYHGNATVPRPATSSPSSIPHPAAVTSSSYTTPSDRRIASGEGSNPELTRRIASGEGSNPELSRRIASGEGSNPESTRRIASGEGSNPELSRRPLRERLVHMLATRPFKKPEIFGRLHQEGLKEKDKKLVMPVLRAIGLMKDNVYHLARHVWNEVHDDWPFYTDQERQMLKRRRPESFTPPGSDSSSGSGHSPSTTHPSESPTSGSSLRPSQRIPQKRSVPPEPAGGPPLAKKPNIQPRKPAESVPDSSFLSSSIPDSRSPLPRNHKAAPSPLKPRTSPINQASPSTQLNQSRDSFRSSPSVSVPTKVSSTSSHTPSSSPDSLTENIDRISTLENAEYLHQYQRISNGEQRNRYKADFNAEYREYRDLHSVMEKVSKRFAQLEDSLRQQNEGSAAWQRIKSQIVQEYKENLRGKRRFLYLHEKLAHIKRLVLEWDTSRAQLCRS